MENGYKNAVFVVFIHQHRLLPTSNMVFLLISPGCVPYAIFVAAADIFGAVYHEMAAIYLTHWIRRYQWW